LSVAIESIGLVTARWWPEVGGVETHARQLASWLAARGVRVEVLCMDADPERAAFETHDERDGAVSVRRVAYRYQDHETLADLGKNEQMEAAALQWAEEVKVDLLHIHHLTGWGHGLMTTLASCAPIVLTLHDYWTICPRGQLWTAEDEVCRGPSPERCAPCLRATWPHLFNEGEDASEQVSALSRCAAEAFGAASVLLAPSTPAMQTLEAAGVPAERLRAFSLGVECSGLAEEVDRLRDAAPMREERVIGVLGAVQPTKGVLELARAVVESELPGLRLRVHGPRSPFHGDSSYVEALETLAAESPVVELCGSYSPEQLPEVLASLDAVAAPALWEEGFGLSVREASAVGLPVLVSDAGGLPELVGRDGAVGVIARRSDPDGLIDALRWMDAADCFGVIPESERPKLVDVDEMCQELAGVYEAVLAAHDSQASSSAAADTSQE